MYSKNLRNHVASIVDNLDGADDIAASIDEHHRTIHQPHAVAAQLHGGDLALDLGRGPDVVRIDEGDQVGGRAAPTRIASSRNTGIVLPDDPDAAVDHGVSLRDGTCAISRPIVYDDNLKFLVRACNCSILSVSSSVSAALWAGITTVTSSLLDIDASVHFWVWVTREIWGCGRSAPARCL